MIDAHPVSRPMVSYCKLSKITSPAFFDSTLYCLVVGSVQYAIIARPNINYAINKVCQFLSHPLECR